MATIVMESAKVIDAAIAAIARIEDERTFRDNQMIDMAMQPYKKFFGLFTVKEKTMYEAIQYLDKNCDLFGWRSMYAGGKLEKLLKLHKLAQHGDPVTLNQEDINILF